MTLSKVLIIGGTGYLGKHIVNASLKLGHPTFVLVRTTTPSDSAKAALLKSFEDAGATLLVGDISDYASLVSALKQVDVVISAVSGPQQTLEQAKILEAAKETGTIKRFLPSEFGNDVDRIAWDVPASAPSFSTKSDIRRLAEKSGIPYTFVCSGSFAGFYVAPICQDLFAPPRDGKLTIYGDGNAKVIFTDEVDIGTFTLKCIDDPRAANKILHIKAKENVLSQNEVTAMWEKKIGHVFEKETLDKEAVFESIAGLSFPEDLYRGIKYSIFVKGDQTSFSFDPAKDVEATELYPDVKYTTVDQYLDRLL